MIEVLTFVLVLVTGYYALVTRQILKANEQAVTAMKEQTEAVSRPYVTVSHFLGNDGTIYLRIANTGQTSAQDLKLDINEDFYQLGVNHEQYKISNLTAFKAPIRHLPPGAEITFALKEIDQVIMTKQVVLPEKTPDAPTPPVFSITARYSYSDKVVEERTDINLTLYHGTFKEFDAIVRQLAAIRQELHEISVRLPQNTRDAV